VSEHPHVKRKTGEFLTGGQRRRSGKDRRRRGKVPVLHDGLGAEMLYVGRDLQQRGGTGAEQQVVDDLLVLESQPREFMRNREDHMEVADGK